MTADEIVKIEVEWKNVSRTLAYVKGQLISKAIYGVLDSPKKWTKKIWLDIS